MKGSDEATRRREGLDFGGGAVITREEIVRHGLGGEERSSERSQLTRSRAMWSASLESIRIECDCNSRQADSRQTEH